MIDGIKQLGSLSLTRGTSNVSSLTDSIFGSQQTTPAQQTGASFASVLGNMSTDPGPHVSRWIRCDTHCNSGTNT